MEIVFKKSFTKALKFTPKSIQKLTANIISKLAQAKSLEKAGVYCTKIEGQKKNEHYYRVRIGDWHIGFEYLHPKIIIIAILT